MSDVSVNSIKFEQFEWLATEKCAWVVQYVNWCGVVLCVQNYFVLFINFDILYHRDKMSKKKKFN